MVKLFVGNLNPQSKSADLQKKFEAFGKVTECDIVNNYGFVHMETEQQADAALAGLTDCILDGVKINVERSHGKRTGGPGGPMKRRFRDGPPGPFRGPPQRFMGGPPPPRMGRYGPSYDDGYGGSYGPPPPRGGPGHPSDRPMNGNSRYPGPDRGEPVRMPPRGPGREPLPPPAAGYRGPPAPESSAPPRDFAAKGAPPRPSYGEYDRYRDAPVQPSRQGDYYDNYGNYSSGGYDEYQRDGDRPATANYDNYDYGYYDYGSEQQRPAPPRYNYGRQ